MRREASHPSRGTQLRVDFDAAFTRAHSAVSPGQLDLLLIRVGGHPYALPLSQVLALHADRPLTKAPSSRRELLGLVGLRGVVTPVYDLSVLLGYPAPDSTRFLVQVDVASPFALSFEHFERHVRVLASALAPFAREGEAAQSDASGSVSLGSGPVTVLDLRAIFLRTTPGAGPRAPQSAQERQ